MRILKRCLASIGYNKVMGTILETRAVRKRYQTLEVLRGIDLKVEAGKVVAIVGPSGAGKTTLLQILGTLLRPDGGEVWVAGKEVVGMRPREQAYFRNREIGFVFQFHHLLPECSALENVCIPALIQGLSLEKAKRRANDLLDYLGLTPRANHKPSALSGGEQQRVAVCRALMNDAPLILADEPSGNLDSENRAELHSLFFRLRDEMGKTFIVVTHDDALAESADVVVPMRDGQIVDR